MILFCFVPTLQDYVISFGPSGKQIQNCWISPSFSTQKKKYFPQLSIHLSTLFRLLLIKQKKKKNLTFSSNANEIFHTSLILLALSWTCFFFTFHFFNLAGEKLIKGNHHLRGFCLYRHLFKRKPLTFTLSRPSRLGLFRLAYL